MPDGQRPVLSLPSSSRPFFSAHACAKDPARILPVPQKIRPGHAVTIWDKNSRRERHKTRLLTWGVHHSETPDEASTLYGFLIREVTPKKAAEMKDGKPCRPSEIVIPSECRLFGKIFGQNQPDAHTIDLTRMHAIPFDSDHMPGDGGKLVCITNKTAVLPENLWSDLIAARLDGFLNSLSISLLGSHRPEISGVYTGIQNPVNWETRREIAKTSKCHYKLPPAPDMQNGENDFAEKRTDLPDNFPRKRRYCELLLSAFEAGTRHISCRDTLRDIEESLLFTNSTPSF
jgi:hypothetical protein